MELDYKKLTKKILEFWQKYDNMPIQVNELKNVFNFYEISTILWNDNYLNNYSSIVENFRNKIHDLNELFTEKEALKLVESIDQPTNLLKYLKDESLLSLISENNFDLVYDIAFFLSSDEAKIKGFNLVQDLKLKANFISQLNSDELKLNYLKYINSENKYRIISTIKDDNLLEKHITFFSTNKGDFISNLSNDSKKVYYLKKYFRLLNNDEKINIISSLNDEEQIFYLLNFCSDSVKSGVACVKYELSDRIIQTINNKTELGKILKYNSTNIELIDKYIEHITDINELTEIISLIDDEYKIKYLSKLDDTRKIEFINEIYDGQLKFKAFECINDKKILFQLISHCEVFPEYSFEYDYIIDLYSEKYNLNKNQLLIAVKNVSLSLLKYIENPNIIKIINSQENEFMLIMKLFNKDELKMNLSSLNDILNSLLQRNFRNNSAETILLFSNMLSAIENNNKELLTEKLHLIFQTTDISDELATKSWNFDMFVQLLLEKNEISIEILHTYTNKYINNKRNAYVQDNLQNAIEVCTYTEYDKNDLIKYMLTNYPMELIVNLFKNEIAINENLYAEEVALLKNTELIQKIILYKKNPNLYANAFDEIKRYFKIFNQVFDNIIADCSSNVFPDINAKKKISGFKNVDTNFLINIMMNLDINKMINLFNNPELLNKLLKYWQQYKIGGWEDVFTPLLNNAGIFIDAEVVANFLQYFDLSYQNLQDKINKGQISNISLTALLDLSSCYNSESKKYSILFGNENFKYIASNPGPNASTMLKDQRIKSTIKYIKTIRNRKYVSVPAFDKNVLLENGKLINVVVGNFSNMINLTYGERTGSCMRIGGAGESLFDFCLENDNGFHIRFSNPDTGNFVSRVSGFRNGNTVFLNELRYSEDPHYSNKDIVEACKLISEELIKESQNSNLPIENVIITPFYSMEESGMQKKNLQIPNPQLGLRKFYTDVSSTSIVLATSNNSNEILPVKLGIKNVPKYFVARDKQNILYNKEAQEFIAHINILDQLLSNNNVDDLNFEIDTNIIACFAGDDWYVAINADGSLSEYIMNNSNNKQQAIDEMQDALNYLKLNVSKEIEISNNSSLNL